MSVDPFWIEYWQALSSVPPHTIGPPRALLEAYRSIAQQTLQGVSHQKSESKTEHDASDSSNCNDTFAVAWAAHSLLSTRPDLASVLAGCKSFSWQQKVGCVVMLEACCRKFLKHNKLVESPIFPLLLQDTLAAVQATHMQQQQQRPSSHQHYHMLRAEMELERECLLEIAESLIPDMIGREEFDHMRRLLSEGKTSPELMRLLEQSIHRYTDAYRDGLYVMPAVLANKESEINDIKRLLESNRAMAKVSIHNLLNPISSLKAPFARPLPPSLLPCVGYHVDDEAVAERDEPEVLDYLHAELLWLTPTNLRLMLIPDDESEDKEANERYQQVLALVKKQAFSKALAPNEQHNVMQVLGTKVVLADGGSAVVEDEDHNETANRLIRESGLTPQNLPRLVEYNPLVANECVLRILSGDDENLKNDYLASLVGMDMSLQSMEVVNRLATHQPPILHPEYINLFISSCIATCENVPDRHAQNRLVRLVCVFIQSLLRNKIVQANDIFFELQSFCVEFSRIREASALFKSMKELYGSN
ncbi:hypothetical protein MPSEU_000720100 [Mayamaea pseudoterrestris]|nr:hypothetical protein MPSEU_000720100 [Mayamaea pseudoterrestris]